MGEVTVGQRRSGRLPVAPCSRGKCERWPESKRGGAWVKLTDGGGSRHYLDVDGGALVG
jgi:hypothetical protein